MASLRSIGLAPVSTIVQIVLFATHRRPSAFAALTALHALSSHSGKHREPAGKLPFLPDFCARRAPFYSVGSMSTCGVPGLMRERHWRMMGALEARDGMLRFGVGAAYIFTVRQACWALMIRPHWVKIWCSRPLMA